MYVPEIAEIKTQLDVLKQSGLITSWELPYENLLTRRSAAIFFVTPATDQAMSEVQHTLEQHEHFNYRLNEEKKLSQLQYRITFNKEEKEKNALTPLI